MFINTLRGIGSIVSTAYYEARQQAGAAARARNSLLDNATKAYIGGNKQLAKDLSAQGHTLNMEMKDLHAKVCSFGLCLHLICNCFALYV